MYYISRIAGTAALAALGIAVWFSIVLARADFYFRGATVESVERAVEIAPRNTEYLALRALQMEYDGADSRALTEKIAALNPYASAPRIRLGLAAEVAGDSAGAERWLLDAARVDHQFEPRWTLANFYFRAGKREEFWRWMRAALEVSYGDRSPAYELCWRVSDDAEEILRLGIPDRHEVVGSYLVFLLQREPPDRRLPPKLAAPPGWRGERHWRGWKQNGPKRLLKNSIKKPLPGVAVSRSFSATPNGRKLMCPACIQSYITTATVIAGSTGGLAAVVQKIRNQSKGESRWHFIKLFLKMSGSQRGRSS
jgi:hypothetical protein